MGASIGRRVRSIIDSGSLKTWEKPAEFNPEDVSKEEIDAVEAELDAMLGQGSDLSDAEWEALQRSTRRMR